MFSAIRTDNGPPFASTALGGLTTLSIWWVKLGIVPEGIEPGHPEQNGHHERMHPTLKEETTSPPKASMAAQQRTFDSFRDEYNQVRPHEAFGQRPPDTVYHTSERTYPGLTREHEYPRGVSVRRVRSNSEIKWKGAKVYLTQVLTGESVGLNQESENTWAVYFGPLQIGLLNETPMKVIKTPVRLFPMSPV